MRNKREVLILLGVLILFSILFLVQGKEVVNDEIGVTGLAKGINFNDNGKADVLIEFGSKQEEVLNNIGRDEINLKQDKRVYAELNIEQIRELSKIQGIKILPEVTRKIFLQDSVGVVNASVVWIKQQGGNNLTGAGQTVCILDTGVNYTHADLGGGFGAGYKVLGGWDFVNNDNNPMDDNGHGTHVAGIVAANGTVKGVAPGAKIIAIKVCNAAGSCGDSAIINGINWCINNASIFNISVISMSLGGGNYSGYCDNIDVEVAVAEAVNNASSRNISVVVATGNDGLSMNISSPACVSGAFPVASSNKADNSISSFSNRWNNSSLIVFSAPGELIYSTYLGGYAFDSGTSMATPHVAGELAIIKQFMNLTSVYQNSSQLKNILNSTGKFIFDSSASRYISRADVYSSLKQLKENFVPLAVSLGSPLNSTRYYNLTNNLSFSCNASNGTLRMVEFYLWNSTDLYNYSSLNINAGSYNYTANVSNIPEGNYSWNCKYTDDFGNSAFASVNNTLLIKVKQVILIGMDGVNWQRFEALLLSGNLSNFTRLVNLGGWNGTANITGHATTTTAPGNAELHTGLNSTYTGIVNNTPAKTIPDGKTTYERLKVQSSDIKTGFVYGKTTAYIPNKLLANATGEIDWAFNKTSFTNTNFNTSGMAYSENVSNKAKDFIDLYLNNSFYLVVYYGVSDGIGHAYGDNSSIYNDSIVNEDRGLGVLLDYLNETGILNDVEIIVSADHGWNLNTENHDSSSGSIILPLLTNDANMVANNSDGIRKQCDIAPTILDYFGVNVSSYSDITGNGCYSMYGDGFSPIVSSLSSGSLTTSSVVISWSSNEPANYTLSLSNGVNYTNSSYSTSFSFSISGLSSGTAYTYTLSVCDVSGNCNSSSTGSFTTSSSGGSEHTGGSGGSGSSGGGAVISQAVWTNTLFEDGNIEDKVTLNKNLKVKERVRIFFEGEMHYVGVLNLTNNRATINVSSKSQQVELGVGEEKNFDLDEDNIYDLNVKLNSIVNNSISNITLTWVNESKVVVNEGTKVNETSNNSNVSQEKEKSMGERFSVMKLWIKHFINNLDVWQVLIVGGAVIVLILSIVLIFIIRNDNTRKR